MSRLVAAAFVIASSASLAACTDRDERVLASQPVGAEGGRIELGGGGFIDIPAGAMSGTETISVSTVSASAVPEITPIAPVLRFEPEGLTFTEPVVLVLPLPEGAENGVVWWSNEDGGMEVAGFAHEGVAVATSTHFSDVAVGEPTCAANDEDGDCTGCGEQEPDEPTCNPCREPTAATCQKCATGEPEPGTECSQCDGAEPRPCGLRRDKCRRLCRCEPGDPMARMNPLCATQPENNTSFCTANPAIPSNDGTQFLGRADGDPCSGWSYQGIMVTLCRCDATTPNGPAPEDLCPIAFADVVPGDGVRFECHSTLEWGSLENDEHPAEHVPDSPAGDDNDLGADRTTSAYVKEGASGTSCKGHWLDQRDNENVKDGGVLDGELVCAPLNESVHEVDIHWREFAGTAITCDEAELYWPAGMTIPPQSDEDATRCRMSRRDWLTLDRLRAFCGVPHRRTDAEEDQTRIDEVVQGIPKDQRQRNFTLATLTSYTEGALEQNIVGTSKNARDMRSQAGASCPPALPFDEAGWTNIGVTVGTKQVNSNATRGHAEGHALLQLAESRGRRPTGDKASPEMATGERRGGCAEMLVDRVPCASSCAPEGIDRAREAAGLDRLFVRSPAGCVQYGTTTDDRMHGIPCATADQGCAQ